MQDGEKPAELRRKRKGLFLCVIKQRLNIDPVLTPGKAGQFEVVADGERIAERGGNWFTRSVRAGYPDLDSVVDQLERRRGSGAAG